MRLIMINRLTALVKENEHEQLNIQYQSISVKLKISKHPPITSMLPHSAILIHIYSVLLGYFALDRSTAQL